MPDALSQLRNDGYANATDRRIYHAFSAGHVNRPGKDGANRYVFTDRDLDNIRRYLKNVPSRGPRPASK